jgi:hypothetical protein
MTVFLTRAQFGRPPYLNILCWELALIGAAFGHSEPLLAIAFLSISAQLHGQGPDIPFQNPPVIVTS